VFLINTDFLFDLPNQILVERQEIVFADVEYEKLSLFCSNCKMISHNLSNYER